MWSGHEESKGHFVKVTITRAKRQTVLVWKMEEIHVQKHGVCITLSAILDKDSLIGQTPQTSLNSFPSRLFGFPSSLHYQFQQVSC